MTTLKKEIKPTPFEILNLYLEKMRFKKTQERNMILDYIYSRPIGHFTIDELHEDMQQQKMMISRVTVYNTVNLLSDCGLLHKHQFSLGLVQYERADQTKVHYHLVCSQCGAIKDASDKIFQAFIQNRKMPGFKVDLSRIYIYGLCGKCAKVKTKKKKS